VNATLIRGDDGGLHVRQFATLADSIAACAAHDPKWPTMTPDECDRLLERARRRRAERAARGGWIAHHREIYSTLCPGVPPTRNGSFLAVSTVADSHQPKLARGIQF
jgi:hypothetical protein